MSGTDRNCVTCGKRFVGRYRQCYECRATDQSCTSCGAAFHGTHHLCAQCTSTKRQCVTCGKTFTSRYKQCRTCRSPHAVCQAPGCGNVKMPGRGVKYCLEHAYQHLRKNCGMPGCEEPKLTGKFRYCARHSAEGPQRERAQIVRRARERKYGLTHDEFQALLTAQGDVCAICGNGQQQRALAVDHDHETGTIRGLLCDRCNPLLGYARDDIAVLQAAIQYLTKWSGIQAAPLGVSLNA